MKKIGSFGFVPIAAVFTLQLLLVQCSSHVGRNLLTFFFDGVPAPEQDTVVIPDSTVTLQDPASYETIREEIPELTALVHWPYQQGDCRACHDPGSPSMLVNTEPGLCYLCHEELSESYSHLHGPVSGGYCTACHDPHRSEYSALTRFAGPQLCYFCHPREQVEKSELHRELEGMVCSDCHNPHGGDDRFILY